MAARSSSGTGTVVALAIMSVLAVVFGVASLIVLIQHSKAKRDLADREQKDRVYIQDAERQRDDVKSLVQGLRGESLVSHLIDTNGELMNLSIGQRNGNIEDVQNAKKNAGINAPNFLSEVRQLNRKLTERQRDLDAAEAERERAIQDRNTEAERVLALEEELRGSAQTMASELLQYRDEADRYRGELQTAKADMQGKIEENENDARERESQLKGMIEELERELLRATDRANKLQSELRGQRYEGEAEEALVDGRVIGLDSVSTDIFINLGREQKVRIGTRFELYDSPSAIRPDDQGNYPDGKASIEIIEVSQNSSKCRVLRSTRGNPVAKGDVIVNAVYDPNKTYTVLVYGNFDTNNDGKVTAVEAVDIRARVEEWGGSVTEELSGSIDFLVLGERPTLPPEPPLDAPSAVARNYVRAQQAAQRYDTLFEKAVATSIPVLNQNRLETLTGGISSY